MHMIGENCDLYFQLNRFKPTQLYIYPGQDLPDFNDKMCFSMSAICIQINKNNKLKLGTSVRLSVNVISFFLTPGKIF